MPYERGNRQLADMNVIPLEKSAQMECLTPRNVHRAVEASSSHLSLT